MTQIQILKNYLFNKFDLFKKSGLIKVHMCRGKEDSFSRDIPKQTCSQQCMAG